MSWRSGRWKRVGVLVVGLGHLGKQRVWIDRRRLGREENRTLIVFSVLQFDVLLVEGNELVILEMGSCLRRNYDSDGREISDDHQDSTPDGSTLACSMLHLTYNSLFQGIIDCWLKT